MLAIVIVAPLGLFAVLSATRLAGPMVARITRAVLAGLLSALLYYASAQRVPEESRTCRPSG